MRMRIAVGLALGALVAASCSRPANQKLDELADRACACKDFDCARKIGDDYAAWWRQYEGTRGDPAQADRSTTRMMSCLMKVGGDRTIDKAIDKMDRSEKGSSKPADGAGAADKASTGDTGDKPADKPADKATDK